MPVNIAVPTVVTTGVSLPRRPARERERGDRAAVVVASSYTCVPTTVIAVGAWQTLPITVRPVASCASKRRGVGRAREHARPANTRMRSRARRRTARDHRGILTAVDRPIAARIRRDERVRARVRDHRRIVTRIVTAVGDDGATVTACHRPASPPGCCSREPEPHRTKREPGTCAYAPSTSPLTRGGGTSDALHRHDEPHVRLAPRASVARRRTSPQIVLGRSPGFRIIPEPSVFPVLAEKACTSDPHRCVDRFGRDCSSPRSQWRGPRRSRRSRTISSPASLEAHGPRELRCGLVRGMSSHGTRDRRRSVFKPPRTTRGGRVLRGRAAGSKRLGARTLDPEGPPRETLL